MREGERGRERERERRERERENIRDQRADQKSPRPRWRVAPREDGVGRQLSLGVKTAGESRKRREEREEEEKTTQARERGNERRERKERQREDEVVTSAQMNSRHILAHGDKKSKSYSNCVGVRVGCVSASLVMLSFHCTALHLTALHSTSLHCTSPHLTALHRTSPQLTALHFSALYFASLHFTSFLPLLLFLRRIGSQQHRRRRPLSRCGYRGVISAGFCRLRSGHHRRRCHRGVQHEIARVPYVK